MKLNYYCHKSPRMWCRSERLRKNFQILPSLISCPSLRIATIGLDTFHASEFIQINSDPPRPKSPPGLTVEGREDPMESPRRKKRLMCLPVYSVLMHNILWGIRPRQTSALQNRRANKIRFAPVLEKSCVTYPYNLGLGSTLKPQCGKVCFIVKSRIGLSDLRLCLL